MLKYLLIFTLIIIILEIYTYTAIRALTTTKWLSCGYLFLSIFILSVIVYQIISFTDTPHGRDKIGSFSLLAVVFFLPKIFLILPLILEDLFRIFSYLFQSNEAPNRLPERRRAIGLIAMSTASVSLLNVIYGVIWGKYNFKVMRKTLYFEDLPEAFDGFTITQLSDIHSGSFDNVEKVRHGVDLALRQNSDLILFTGDLVNNKADEMKAWTDIFGRLKAPHGVFSVLGNHDYGDYISWPSPAAKAENLKDLCETHKKMGFELLRNQNREIKKDAQSIHIIGVENWGLPPFPQHGDLDRATENVPDKAFKILLSHDPSHFDARVKQYPEKIHLTLSGHTHGMQFGIEIPGWIRWSPVKYRYPKWAGLYKEKGRYLYVNRGFGWLAFPGRVGIWPEITVLKLRKKKTG